MDYYKINGEWTTKWFHFHEFYSKISISKTNILDYTFIGSNDGLGFKPQRLPTFFGNVKFVRVDSPPPPKFQILIQMMKVEHKLRSGRCTWMSSSSAVWRLSRVLLNSIATCSSFWFTVAALPFAFWSTN